MDNIISSLSLLVMQAFEAMADICGIVMNLPGGRPNEGGAEMTGAQQNASVATFAGGVGRSGQAGIQTGLAPRPFRRTEPEDSNLADCWSRASLAVSDRATERAICLSALRRIPG